MLDEDVANLDVFDPMPGNAADHRAVTRGGVRTDDVTDQHPAEDANGNALRTAHAAAQPEEQGGIRDIPHGDVGDGHVLQGRSVYRFKHQPPVMRPVLGTRSPASNGLKSPCSRDPIAKLPLTRQFVIVTISVERRGPGRRSFSGRWRRPAES